MFCAKEMHQDWDSGGLDTNLAETNSFNIAAAGKENASVYKQNTGYCFSIIIKPDTPADFNRFLSIMFEQCCKMFHNVLDTKRI